MTDGFGMRERYESLRAKWPEIFVNPPGAAFEIITDDAQVERAEQAQEVLLASEGLPESWSRTGVVSEDHYIIFVRDAVRRLDGTFGTYDRILPASGLAGVAVLPVLNDRVVLVRHFRHATRKFHLEAPRGFGEYDVSVRQQAKDELYEEIGARVREEDLIALGQFHSNSGIASDCVELFIARIEGTGSLQEEEGISSLKECSPRELAEMISAGEITDSFTIGAFTRAWLKGLLPDYPSPIGESGRQP
jgi:ADP-ribose pyrophosphatase